MHAKPGKPSRIDIYITEIYQMATVAEQVQQIYIGLLGRAADQEGATYWEGQINSGAITLDQMRANFVEEQPEYTALVDGLTRTDIVNALYERMFERAPEAAGAEYWINGAGSSVSIDQLSITFMNAALGSDITALANKTAAAAAYTAAAGSNYTAAAARTAIDSVDETPASLAASIAVSNALFTGETRTLTSNRDVVTGTDSNDTIYADVGQNSLGAVSNALASGDIVNGEGGYDTLISTMINDSVVDTDGNTHSPLPRLNSVEEVRIQALEDITLDADHITGEEKFASDSSRADLVITNVDIESTQITKDLKLEMKDTQQFSDFEVYFNQNDLKAAPDVTVGSASVTLQVADGAQATGTTTPLVNMTFDLSFTQGTTSHSFEDIESTDGTYAGLVTAIQVALAAEGLTQYAVVLDGEFTSFETGSASVDLNYTGSFITIRDNNQNEFSAISFAPQQKAGSAVAILLAQSEVNAEATTSSFLIESDITVDNVGRGSNGGEIVIGSTSNSDSSTGVARINVTVENSSVVSDISSTNDALQHITLTNGTVKGNFVLANADFDAADTDNAFTNVDQVNLVKEGLTSIVATDFDGDIVLGRDANLVDLGMLSAAVNGDVTYNATLNDGDAYTATTGAGADTINITLDDNRIEANTDTDTAVTISTGAANDTITVNEDNAALEVTTATIDAGAGDDVVTGNDVSVTVTAGAGNDAVYAENTGEKALLSIGTNGLYTTAVAATQGVGHTDGEVHFLEGREVSVTIATNGVASDQLVNGYETATVAITASSGALTTLADLNAAVVKSINEDPVASKIVIASIDENNNVVVQYLVDGAQLVTGVELTVTNPTAATSVSTAMSNEYRDLVNNSTLTAANVLGLYNADLSSTTLSTATHEGSTIAIGTAGTAGDTVTVLIGDDTVTYTATGVIATDATALADALIAEGYDADGVTVAGTVAVITDKEVLLTDGGTTPTTVATITNDVALDETDIAILLGTDSVDNDNLNSINGGAGDDVIVLSSDDTVADTVVWTDYAQGDDTIVHFVTGTDELDFTSYLTGTVDANNSGSSSDESEIALTVTTAATDTFTANSINLIDFDALDAVIATQTFETLTAAQLEAALEADASANTVLTTAPGDLYQTNGVSVLVIQDAANANGAVVGDTLNEGTYKAYEVSYADATTAAGATDFTVKLIGSFDLGDATTNTLVVGDFTL
jgi:hypothetical protein